MKNVVNALAGTLVIFFLAFGILTVVSSCTVGDAEEVAQVAVGLVLEKAENTSLCGGGCGHNWVDHGTTVIGEYCHKQARCTVHGEVETGKALGIHCSSRYVGKDPVTGSLTPLGYSVCTKCRSFTHLCPMIGT